jgi:hypothetical protein
MKVRTEIRPQSVREISGVTTSIYRDGAYGACMGEKELTTSSIHVYDAVDNTPMAAVCLTKAMGRVKSSESERCIS